MVAGSPRQLQWLLVERVAAGELARHRGSWRWAEPDEPGVSSTAVHSLALAGHRLASGDDSIPRLPTDLQLVIGCAAIFGQTAWLGAVLALLRGLRTDTTDSQHEVDRAHLKGQLVQLQNLGWLQFADQARYEGDYEFQFVDPTAANAALNGLPAHYRRRLSRLAAQWLASHPILDSIGTPARIAELYANGGDHHLAAFHCLAAGNAARNAAQLHRALALFAIGCRHTRNDDAALGCDLRTALGGGLLRLSRLKDARLVLGEALHMGRCIDDDERCGIAQLRLSQVARLLGEYDVSIDFLDGANDHFGAVSAHRWIADVCDEVGKLHLARGAAQACMWALQHFLKALALRRRGTDRRAVARSLCHVARVHLSRGHHQDAINAVQEAAQLCETAKDRWAMAEVEGVAGEVWFANNQFAVACGHWDKAARLATEVGDQRRTLEVALVRAEACVLHGDTDQAQRTMAVTLAWTRELNDPELWSAYYRIQAAIALQHMDLGLATLDSERAVEAVGHAGAGFAAAKACIVRGCVLGTCVLVQGGTQATAIDQTCTRDFEFGLETLHAMGDLVRYVQGLRSYVGYLTKRGGGPRLKAAARQLRVAEDDLTAAAGTVGAEAS